MGGQTGRCGKRMERGKICEGSKQNLPYFWTPGQKIGKIHSEPIKTLLTFIKETAMFKGEV